MTPEQLKASVLQYAMQGKLTEQNLNDRTAFEKIKDINKEIERKASNKEIRKEKILPTEINKALPENWESVRLTQLCKVENGSIRRGPFGSSITKSMFVPKSNETYKVYEQGNAIRKDINYGDYYVSEEHFQELKNFEIVPGDIIVSCAGTIGETFILPENSPKGIINQALLKLSINEEIIRKDFFMRYFESIVVELKRHAKGSAMKNLASLKFLKNEVSFSVPPLEEQNRIVKKIEELFEKIDQYAESYNKLEELNKQFPVKMEKSLLQYAMQGKLVPQNPSDEPASELLKQIKAEKEQLIRDKKIKKEKPLPEITEEEIPFEIPESWEWVRLGEIAELINGDRGKNYPSRTHWIETGVPFLNAASLGKPYLNYDNFNFISEEKFSMLRSGFTKSGDILYCLRGSLGKLSINLDVEKGAIASSIVIIRGRKVVIKYLYYLLYSPFGNELIKKVENGTAQPNLSASSVNNYVIPIPPLNEQKRIVQELELITKYVEKLKI